MTDPKPTPAALQRLKREEELAQRTKLIDMARAGDKKAQQTLSQPPYKMRVFTEKEIEAVEAKSKKG
jgi:hypothetical protein